MENYMGDRIVIGGYVVDYIEMLDDTTCAMYFKEFTEGDVMYGIVAEYWLDDDSWHFSDNRFALNGFYIDDGDSTHLTDKDKEKCKEFIKNWIEENGK